MYVPDAFQLNDPVEIRRVLTAYPLASFATNGPDGPHVSHLPLIVRDEENGLVLYGHFARANPHWKELGGSVRAVAVFRGPQGYVSPNWYATKQETGKVVPTWNYIAVHARGIPQILTEMDHSHEAVDLLTDAMEQPRDDPWKVADAPESYTASMLRGIVAFRMVVDRLEATAKLSQNKNAADFEGVTEALKTEGSGALAGAMRAVEAKK